MGGPSAERDISLVTGKAVCENLDKKKYEILPIEISKEGKFLFDATRYKQLNSARVQKSGKTKYQVMDLQNKVAERKKMDVVFNALHGTFGEDGAIQGMLECLGVKYTGSGILASALAMNKDAAAKMYHAHGIPTPPYMTFTKEEWKENPGGITTEVRNRYGFPVVIKPVNQGSAVGVSIVKAESDLAKAITTTLKQFNWLMAQEFITGKEATCGVLEKDGKAFALPPTRIIANANEFYDYNSKYKAGGSTHVCPADFSADINEAIQDLALKAHMALGCRGMSRTDVMVGHDGQLWVLETNTIPGMTPTSLLPEAAGKAGINFSAMLDLIIKAAR